MDRCPNCRARLDGAAQCRRCGLELNLLQAADRAGDAALARAIRRLADGDVPGAVRDLERARALSGDPLVPLLLAFARAQSCSEIPADHGAATRHRGIEPRSTEGAV
jgi:hypothetical protein